MCVCVCIHRARHTHHPRPIVVVVVACVRGLRVQPCTTESHTGFASGGIVHHVHTVHSTVLHRRRRLRRFVFFLYCILYKRSSSPVRPSLIQGAIKTAVEAQKEKEWLKLCIYLMPASWAKMANIVGGSQLSTRYTSTIRECSLV
jgi:hypothetical protein